MAPGTQKYPLRRDAESMEHLVKLHRDVIADLRETAFNQNEQIRKALGPHNDDAEPVVYLVAGLVAEVERIQKRLDAMHFAGTRMSNACYNLAQWADRLPEGQSEILKQMQLDWDAAITFKEPTT